MWAQQIQKFSEHLQVGAVLKYLIHASINACLFGSGTGDGYDDRRCCACFFFVFAN
jgi:hypothetical protein